MAKMNKEMKPLSFEDRLRLLERVVAQLRKKLEEPKKPERKVWRGGEKEPLSDEDVTRLYSIATCCMCESCSQYASDLLRDHGYDTEGG